MRLLERARPEVDVANLVVFAVPGEDVGVLPGAQDQVVVLLVLVAQRGRIGAEAEVVVHRGADRESGDEASARHHVEHGHFLGHAGGRVVERDRLAEQQDRHVLGAAREGGGHQLGRGHHPIGVLVMLVDADAVEAERGRVFELVEVLVIDAVAFDGVVEAGVDIDPDGAVGLAEVLRQVGPGHQVEPVEFHGESPVLKRCRPV